jgi:hypothetical protein
MSAPIIPSSAKEFSSLLRDLKLARYARKHDVSIEKRSALTRPERAAILAKTGGRCHICGGMIESNLWEADHVFAHAGGGAHVVDNYLPAHRLCNNYRWDYSAEEYQHILKLGVWLRREIETYTMIGRRAAEAYLAKETRRARRCVKPQGNQSDEALRDTGSSECPPDNAPKNCGAADEVETGENLNAAPIALPAVDAEGSVVDHDIASQKSSKDTVPAGQVYAPNSSAETPMISFSNSVAAGQQEAQYRRWLQDHPNGFVLAERRNRKGRRTWHRSLCNKVNFDLDGTLLRKRSGRVCFDDRAEFDKWFADARNPSLEEINECPFCRPSLQLVALQGE